MSSLAADLPALFTALGRLGAVYGEFDGDSADPVVQIARGEAAVTLAFFEAGSGSVDPARQYVNDSLEVARRYNSP